MNRNRNREHRQIFVADRHIDLLLSILNINYRQVKLFQGKPSDHGKPAKYRVRMTLIISCITMKCQFTSLVVSE